MEENCALVCYEFRANFLRTQNKSFKVQLAMFLVTVDVCVCVCMYVPVFLSEQRKERCKIQNFILQTHTVISWKMFHTEKLERFTVLFKLICYINMLNIR
jgi:hypothetical protein